MKFGLKNTALALLGVVALSTTSSLRAQIVVNGDFETGNLSGWNLSGNTGFAGVTPGGHNGTQSFFDGAIGSLGLLSQTLTTTAGQSYDITFWILSDGSAPNEMSASFGGVTLFDQVNLPNAGWQQFTFSATALTASTDLTFGFRDDPGFILFDDVSVTRSGPTLVPVPEASTYGIMASAVLAGLVVIRRRKQNAARR